MNSQSVRGKRSRRKETNTTRREVIGKQHQSEPGQTKANWSTRQSYREVVSLRGDRSPVDCVRSPCHWQRTGNPLLQRQRNGNDGEVIVAWRSPTTIGNTPLWTLNSSETKRTLKGGHRGRVEHTNIHSLSSLHGKTTESCSDSATHSWDGFTKNKVEIGTLYAQGLQAGLTVYFPKRSYFIFILPMLIWPNRSCYHSEFNHRGHYYQITSNIELEIAAKIPLS